MVYGHIVSAIIGFSASFFLFSPNLKKWQAKQITTQKLNIVKEALELAEERVIRYEERHDRLLGEICSHYLTSPVMEEALAGSDEAMNEAAKFVVSLRKLQMEIISSY